MVCDQMGKRDLPIQSQPGAPDPVSEKTEKLIILAFGVIEAADVALTGNWENKTPWSVGIRSPYGGDNLDVLEIADRHMTILIITM